MDFEYAPEQEAFRQEFRGWLAANLPPDLCVDDPADERVASDRETFERRRGVAEDHAQGGLGRHRVARGVRRPRRLAHRARDLGRGVLRGARAPVLPGMGLNLVGPTIIHWGTDAQKRQLPAAILNADEIWARASPSPGAGSDLASLRTRAEDRGDHFLVNGQKVWTSGAQFADWIILLVRTDPDAPKHNGISCLLVDMKTPGITRAAAGAGHRPPALQRGLLRRRGGAEDAAARAGQPGLEGLDDHAHVRAPLLRRAQPHRPGARPHRAGHAAADGRRHRVGRSRSSASAWRSSYIDCEAMKYTRFRSLTRQLRGEPPGPEGSILKLFGSELGVRIADAPASCSACTRS